MFCYKGYNFIQVCFAKIVLEKKKIISIYTHMRKTVKSFSLGLDISENKPLSA